MKKHLLFHKQDGHKLHYITSFEVDKSFTTSPLLMYRRRGVKGRYQQQTNDVKTKTTSTDVTKNKKDDGCFKLNSY
jgi:hypothetical protein